MWGIRLRWPSSSWGASLRPFNFFLRGGMETNYITTSPHLLYRHHCFTGKYTTRKSHTNLHPGLEWRIFHILTSEDIDDFTDIKFVS